jgi:hypothetical protein
MWILCERSRVVDPLAARDGETSRDTGPAEPTGGWHQANPAEPGHRHQGDHNARRIPLLPTDAAPQRRQRKSAARATGQTQVQRAGRPGCRISRAGTAYPSQRAETCDAR